MHARIVAVLVAMIYGLPVVIGCGGTSAALVNDIAIAPKTDSIVVGQTSLPSGKGEVVCRGAMQEGARIIWANEQRPSCIAFSGDGRRLFVAREDRQVDVIDYDKSELIESFMLTHSSVDPVAPVHICATPRGERILACYGGVVLIVDVTTKSCKKIEGIAGRFADSSTILVVTDDMLLSLSGNEAREEYRIRLPQGFGASGAMAVSQDGKTAVVGGRKGDITIIDLASRMAVQRHSHVAYIQAAAFDVKGRYFVTADEDGHAKVWAVGTGAVTSCVDLGFSIDSVGWKQNGMIVLGGGTLEESASRGPLVYEWKVGDPMARRVE